MADELAVIYTAANAVQAHLLRNALTEAGIQAQVTNDVLQAAGGDLPLGWTIAPRVLVPREQEAEARRLAEQYDSSLSQNREQITTEPDDRSTVAQPTCPSCGRVRAAICPFCHTSGRGFRQAEPTGGADGEQATGLICPVCDEPFEGGYLRRCEGCGHDFGEGLETPAVVTAPDIEPMNWRVAVVGLAVVAIIGGLLAYFSSLF
ncbi:MAG TPA: DUF2007 domain-containing protein [Pirellulales bacterium]|jgi:hypothetical protein|nr:DUF2007 domain-containing protein [Pirellulales bacterium]